jgi:hypothetical protein
LKTNQHLAQTTTPTPVVVVGLTDRRLELVDVGSIGPAADEALSAVGLGEDPARDHLLQNVVGLGVAGQDEAIKHKLLGVIDDRTEDLFDAAMSDIDDLPAILALRRSFDAAPQPALAMLLDEEEPFSQAIRLDADAICRTGRILSALRRSPIPGLELVDRARRNPEQGAKRLDVLQGLSFSTIEITRPVLRHRAISGKIASEPAVEVRDTLAELGPIDFEVPRQINDTHATIGLLVRLAALEVAQELSIFLAEEINRGPPPLVLMVPSP